ncbi:hypothetical protein [Candidatus Nitrosocosmicus sp. FF01]|uniref:hypothetical protein n=1 Tax=Candidatus Nitrosocosmicus sp. FF01 TaxID=3397670 RepID=UPI0039E94753
MAKIGDYKNFNGLDKNYFTWFAIYITIGLILSFTVSFPVSLLIYIGIILIVQTYRIKKIQDNYQASMYERTTIKNNKNKGFRAFIESLSNTLFNNPYSSLGAEPLRFVCMNCKKEHKERKCPNCGSGAVRVE